ncbi:hypothetical protein HF650_24230 [Kosakonia sp. SMBL-WEM22]|uniref:hypothetical protein n=1 Tax=Kosakonia sp. SMBL-WEM22 TaxID=2725560 RepID=UPI0016598149|nr:hypothetical protein [Kosakonia sp. SMBL-WEM22]MDV5354466.1 hypothetical protein [Enterobacter asburiae]QNQ22590.1 hypothetical protein HF650_24230 [Kosakonia sp. SMBL-WEM22]
MNRSVVFATGLLTLLPATFSQASESPVYMMSSQVSGDAIMTYESGSSSGGKAYISTASGLSARTLSEIQRDYPKQQGKIKDMESDLEKLGRERDELKRNNDDLSRKVDDMQRSISTLEKQLDELSRKVK